MREETILGLDAAQIETLPENLRAEAIAVREARENAHNRHLHEQAMDQRHRDFLMQHENERRLGNNPFDDITKNLEKREEALTTR